MSVTPELRGTQSDLWDGRYRLYLVDVAPFDSFPAYEHGGPSTVTVGDWCVSYAMGGGIDGYELHVYRSFSDESAPGEHHPLYGTVYPTAHDARRAAYEAGALAFMVYEKDAQLYALSHCLC